MRTTLQAVSIALLLLTACSKKGSNGPDADVLPKLTTTTETAVTSTSVTTGGTITADGGSPITARGICWSGTNTLPTIADSVTTDGSGAGTFISQIKNLIPYSTYNVRAYATNASGTGYGNTILIFTLPGLQIETGEVEINNYVLSCSIQVTIKGFSVPGRLPIAQSGVCWGTTSNPTVAGSKTTYGPLSEQYSHFNNKLALSINSTYYIRGYATTSAGTTYGNQVTYTTGISIGLSYGGGIIFDVDATGKHGLIAAQADQGTTVPWAPVNLFTTATNATSGTDGASNTTKIIAAYGNGGSYAAKACRDYRGGGFSDWFLPSSKQLERMSWYQEAIGGFPGSDFLTSYYYWSSTEDNYFRAWEYDFNPRYFRGDVYEKTRLNRVRAVRAF